MQLQLQLSHNIRQQQHYKIIQIITPVFIVRLFSFVKCPCKHGYRLFNWSLMGSTWLGISRLHALAGANPYLGADYQLVINPLYRAEWGKANSFHGWLCPGLEPVPPGQESNAITIRPSTKRRWSNGR